MLEEFYIIKAKHIDIRVDKKLFASFTNSGRGRCQYCNEYKESVNFSSLCFFPGNATDR